jgi:hypothetical protein
MAYDPKMYPYFDIIESHLTNKKPAGQYEDDPKYGVPKYVVSMCAEILGNLMARCDRNFTMKDVLKADRLASGHADYHHKFALYCSELERGIFI